MRSFWLLPLVASFGCWTTRRPSPTPPPPLEPPLAASAAATDGGEPEPDAPPAPPSAEPSEDPIDSVAELDALVPSIAVSQVSGASEEKMGRLVTVMSKHLDNCGAKEGDQLEIAFLTADGDVATRLRTSNADDAVNNCVLRGIAFDIDSVLPSSLSPSERQSEVRSILTIRFGQGGD